MAQFWLKIAHLSFSIATTPLLKMIPSYGLRPRLWLLVLVKKLLAFFFFFLRKQFIFWNDYVTIAVNRNLSNCENSLKKSFSGFQRVSAAVLSQLSCEDPYTGGWPIYWVHQPVKGMKHWMKWCELRWSHSHFICIPAVHIISFSVPFLSRVDELNKLANLQYMGLHSSAGRALQRQRRGHGFKSRWSPEKLFFGLFLQLLKLPFTAMVT